MTREFETPGPGHWILDRSHYPGGTTPLSAWLLENSMLAGTGKVFSEVGVPLAGVDARMVNGFFYTRMRPLIRPDSPSSKLAPLPILKLAARLHPEFRRREKRAVASFRDKPALAVALEWETTIRPARRAANLRLQSVDPVTLDDGALESYVSELLDHALEGFTTHFWLHGHDLGPIATYLHSAVGWGLDPAASIEALAGASPSTSRPGQVLVELRRLAAEAGVEIETLDDIREVSGEAADLFATYLEDHGQVMTTGYDLTNLTLQELPTVIVRSIKTATVKELGSTDEIRSNLRSLVPAESREEFETLLDDARAVMDMRDDNGPITTEWPVGLLRRGLLAAGARLVDRGVLTDPALALELTEPETRVILSGSTPGDLVARRASRQAEARLTPPDTIGPVEPEPPLETLPHGQRKLVAMVQTAMLHLGMDGSASRDGLEGFGVGQESYIGMARVAQSADDAIEMLEPGDVLIVRATSPAFNSVLAIAGAVVTSDGGILSHAAVLARELGIPAVIGVAAALDIADGSIVEVDPIQGLVRIVTGV